MKSIRIIFPVLLLFLPAVTTNLSAQIFGRKSKKTAVATEQKDSVKKSDYKKYDEVLKDPVTDRGMFDVHRVRTDYYFEIPDSLMGRDMLVVNKISGVSEFLNSAGVNKGMGYEEHCIRFYKDTLYKKVWVVTFEPRVSSPDGDAITQSVKSNYREIVRESFPIETIGKDSSTVVVKVNKIFDGSEKSLNNIFGALGIPTSAKKDLSKIESARSFPSNIVVKSVLTTSVSEGDDIGYVTVDVTSNIVLLDKEPMTARFADNRIGYFSTPHIYFNDRQQRVEEREFVNRWRLEPKAEDVEKYLRGELVEPKKQIVLYVDPATPPVWVPYIMKGIGDWQEAFEAAGFKNAIIAREVDPETEPDFDIDDVRYSVVTYAASERANAMGPSVVDPRSGEIIEADIIWWHNVMDLLHSWVRIQTGAVVPEARGNELPVDMMGNAVRFVSSHELGHSLGLRHNFGASYCVPVDSLRSKTYTDDKGTASSIMDYARFNYVAQPGDGVVQLTPRIGIYDKFAIEWGYRWYGAKDPREESKALNDALRLHENDPEYWYGPQTNDVIDPRAQTEDLGDDAIKASRYGIENLKRMMPYITDWTYKEGEMRFEAGKFLLAIIGQWQQYVRHVTTNIGGIYVNDVVYGRDSDRFVPVPADYQRKCMRFLTEEALSLPKWIFADPVWDKTYATMSSMVGMQEYSPQYIARGVHNSIIYSLISNDRLLRMLETEGRAGRANTYTVDEMLGDITKKLFVSAGSGSLDIYKRMEQKSFVDALIISSNTLMAKTSKNLTAVTDGHSDCLCTLMTKEPAPELLFYADDETGVRTTRNYNYISRLGDVVSAKRGELKAILDIVNSRLNSGDKATRNHYYDLKMRIRNALDMK